MYKYRVHYSYSTEKETAPIEVIQDFEFPFVLPLEGSIYLGIIAAKHGIDEKFITVKQVESLAGN